MFKFYILIFFLLFLVSFLISPTLKFFQLLQTFEMNLSDLHIETTCAIISVQSEGF